MKTVSRYWWALGVLFLGVGVPVAANAQDPTIVMVPNSQENPGLPHIAHVGAPITLKAILRNANCASGYRVWWNVNGNESFDDDAPRDVTTRGGTVYDIGVTYTVPDVPRDQLAPVGVRVRNKCNNHDEFGTFRLFVYDWTPSPDPRQWTQDQLDILSAMSVQESMWWMHRQQFTTFGGSGTEIYARYGNTYVPANGPGMWAFTINGHLPAYPPHEVNDARFPPPLPVGWVDKNAARWNNDPYAETVLRFLNDTLRNSSGYQGVSVAIDEANTCGYDANGNQRQCNRIPGTNDGRGAYTGGYSNSTYGQGMMLGGLATVLPALAGTTLQTGGLAGIKYEAFIQQMTDWMGAMQMDAGSGFGGWYYNNQGNQACNYSDGSTNQWAQIGLESAEVAGGPYGVFVNNQHKYRIAENFYTMQGGDGSMGYRCGYTRNFQLTGGAFVAGRWLGIHLFGNDAAVPFPQYSNKTHAQLRTKYNAYLNFTTTQWKSTTLTAHGGGWATRLYRNGDYLCGNTNTAYNAERCGNTYAMYSHQKGYRTGSPEMTLEIDYNGTRVGWQRQFATYYVRAQRRLTNDYASFGEIRDDFCEVHSVTCAYGAPWLAAAYGALVLTPTIFNPKPVAIPAAQPTSVIEGCGGGNSGRVTFAHNQSFHPNANERIIAYQWDYDASNGLWWEGNGPRNDSTDDRGQTFVYTYPRRGQYTATLRVVDGGDPALTDSKTVAITVGEAANVGPSAAHGGPYSMEEGQALQLRGAANDLNLACGDHIAVRWDVIGGAQIGSAADELVPWARLQALPRGQAVRIRLTVTDDAGLLATAETTLTIYPPNPVARGTANPNPAACHQQVRFDGSQSFHPNPQRSIAEYQWNVDGNPGFEGGGPLPGFVFSYGHYGTYNVTLRVTDDLGRTHETSFQVEVNQGNQPPVARVSLANYVVLEGDDLVMDGRQSTDANEECGDNIAAYDWDLDHNGQFNDPVDAHGAMPRVVVANLPANLRNFADPATGLPRYAVTLRVTDGFGASATVETSYTLFRALPIAVVVQNPDPSPISLRNGQSVTTLDGRESSSPVPNMNIAGYFWDLNDDGQFEVADRSVVNFVRVFDPIPGPDDIPDVFIRLKVADGVGREAITRYLVRFDVPPTAPTADADPADPPEPGYHILFGEGVTLDGSQSSDPDEAEFGDYLAAYRWDVTYDAAAGFDPSFETVGDGEAAEPQIDLSAEQLAAEGVNAPGVYPIMLEVEDSTRLTSRDTSTLTVYPREPIAMAVINPNPAACGARVSFDASDSHHPHPDVDVNAWAWDLDGDGQFDDANGESVAHTYQQFSFDGPIRVGLQVTDTNGVSAARQFDLNVNQGNHAPVSAPGGPYAIALNDAVTLDGRASSDPDAACGDSVVSYEWDLANDGSVESREAQQVVTWAQLQAAGINRVGNFSVRLRVTDRFGVSTDAVVPLRVVAGPTAVAEATPNRVGCNDQVEYDGSASFTDGPGAPFEIVRYEWDLDGDGQYEAQGATIVRNAVGNQQITARLRVTDRAGHTATDEVNVRIDVNNVAPVANAGGPYATGRVGAGYAAVTLDGRGSFDPNEPCDDIAVYKWDTDGDGLYGADDNNPNGGNGIAPDVTGERVAGYRNPAWQVGLDQVVRLVVCDVAGACSQPSEAIISVNNEAPPAGEILSPRAAPNVCVGAGNFDLLFRVSDPEGDVVTVTVIAGGVEVAETQVNTPDNGDPMEGSVQVNANRVPEGIRDLQVRFTDAQGGEVVVDAGGRIPFDRTGPVVTIPNDLGDGVCYNPNQVPSVVPGVQDELDPNPVQNSEVLEDGCGRTLRVTATDRCGNEGVGERGYRIAQAVEVEINGAAEGALVAQARMTWEVVGRDDCANEITARLARNGGQPANYAANTLIAEPGNYALTLSIPNCQGVVRQQIRSFAVNAPPVAISIPPGHPALDPGAPGAYIVDEGTGLQLDGSESRPPEQGDQISLYEWDFNGDGVFDAQGELANFDTSEDGVFRGTLRVHDSLGATADAPFQVTVRDVNPVPNAGGPYTVPQGVALQVDGRGTRPGSAADAISMYTWDWGDGTPATQGPNETQPRHTYAADGAYTLTLTVRDEDSEASVEVLVQVRDVDPQIESINPPDPLHEIAPMEFSATVEPGAPGDPITRYEWDFDNDGQPDYAGANRRVVTHYFRDAGRYTITVRVRDQDSESIEVLVVNVREITLGELVAETERRVGNALADNNVPALAKARLNGVDEWLDKASWGERHARRGNTMVALDQLLFSLVRAQASGAPFGNLLWALSRQLVRELDNMRAAILEGNIDEDHPSIQDADEIMAGIRAEYERAGYEADVSGDRNPHLARELYADAYNAYFYLADAIDVCNRYDGFPLPDVPDAVQRVALANQINGQLNDSISAVVVDLQAYLAAGGAEDPGPGRAEVSALIQKMTALQVFIRQQVGILCEQDECITDRDALRAELLVMEIVSGLYDAAGEGVYARNWQNCMVLMIKFRIELSVLRVEFACGRNSIYAVDARRQQQTGLAFLADRNNDEALNYYIHPDRHCLLIRTYNECLVAQFPDQNDAHPFPDFCANDQD